MDMKSKSDLSMNTGANSQAHNDEEICNRVELAGVRYAVPFSRHAQVKVKIQSGRGGRTIALLLIIGATASSALAISKTWTGNATDQSWFSAGN